MLFSAQEAITTGKIYSPPPIEYSIKACWAQRQVASRLSTRTTKARDLLQIDCVLFMSIIIVNFINGVKLNILPC